MNEMVRWAKAEVILSIGDGSFNEVMIRIIQSVHGCGYAKGVQAMTKSFADHRAALEKKGLT